MSPPRRDIADQYSHEISLRGTLITAAVGLLELSGD